MMKLTNWMSRVILRSIIPSDLPLLENVHQDLVARFAVFVANTLAARTPPAPEAWRKLPLAIRCRREHRKIKLLQGLFPIHSPPNQLFLRVVRKKLAVCLIRLSLFFLPFLPRKIIWLFKDKIIWKQPSMNSQYHYKCQSTFRIFLGKRNSLSGKKKI